MPPDPYILPYSVWLSRQDERNDAIGVLAIAAMDGEWNPPNYPNFHEIIPLSAHFRPDIHAAASVSWFEWIHDAVLRPQREREDAP